MTKIILLGRGIRSVVLWLIDPETSGVLIRGDGMDSITLIDQPISMILPYYEGWVNPKGLDREIDGFFTQTLPSITIARFSLVGDDTLEEFIKQAKAYHFPPNEWINEIPEISSGTLFLEGKPRDASFQDSL